MFLHQNLPNSEPVLSIESLAKSHSILNQVVTAKHIHTYKHTYTYMYIQNEYYNPLTMLRITGVVGMAYM